MQFLYHEGTDCVFMDTETYDRIHLGKEWIGDMFLYLKENNNAHVVFYDAKPISIELPATVELTVTETEPALKGATAAAQYKRATLETGLRIDVPPFVAIGEVIQIDTRTGEYLKLRLAGASRRVQPGGPDGGAKPRRAAAGEDQRGAFAPRFSLAEETDRAAARHQPAAQHRRTGVRPGGAPGGVLGLDAAEVRQWRILRKSLDARDASALRFVYTAEVRLPYDEERLAELARRRSRSEVRVDLFEEQPFVLPPPGTEPLTERPVVIGSGPGGLVAAYFLAEQGYRPLVLERGRAVRDRIRDVRAFDGGGPLDPESNYLFGEGGAGTFSDGKLTYRGSGPDVRRVLELFAACKGKPSILYDYRPHLGSNRLPAVVKAIRRRIEALGGEVRFSCRVEDLDLDGGRLRGLATSSGYVPASVAVLAIGHSARDTYAMLLRRGVPMVQKPFQMGVRIEQAQETVNRVKYGPARLEEKLGAADYSLVASGRHDLFSFCMCAGGFVMPSVSEPGAFCTNGMSLSRMTHRSPTAAWW